ncbi:helix-turn-helix domain-containing protein [Carnobacterium sp.]|uniref:helix-turn-helix domain-containing protein n=1 Tax=Carnobacterium sp. TaxID=48221 RepID=UPI00388D4F69
MSDFQLSELLKEIKEKLDLFVAAPVKKVVYTNADVMQMLGVGEKLLKKYRDNGYLGYSHVGDKYFYSEADLAEFLQNSHREAFKFSSRKK